MIPVARVGVTLSHAPMCGVASKGWADCTCGHFQGWGFALKGDRHLEGCPCACTCDFGKRFAEMVKVTQLTSRGVALNLEWQEAEALRDALNAAYPVPRGGIVAQVADAITYLIRNKS
jgi:hypothetical protein